MCKGIETQTLVIWIQPPAVDSQARDQSSIPQFIDKQRYSGPPVESGFGAELEDSNVRLHPGHEWTCAHDQGVQLLVTQSTHSGVDVTGFNGGVSLISFHDATSDKRQVAWVQWTRPGEAGRVAELDSSNHLKSIVPVGLRRHPLDFTALDMRMIWQDTGIKNVKAKWKRDQDRNKMPDHLCTLKEMWTLAEDPSQRHLDNAGNPWECFICSEVASPQLPEHDARKCSLCLLPSHTCCMMTLVSSFDTCEFPLPSVVPTDAFDPIFKKQGRPGWAIASGSWISYL